MSRLRFLVFAGSTGSKSYNKKLAKLAASALGKMDVEATYIELNDYGMPFYDADVEREGGYPVAAAKLKKLMKEHDGLIIASPEYNGSVSAVLKNTIDWLTRSENATTDISAFDNHHALILSTAAGGFGGAMGLRHLRDLLTKLQVQVMPWQLAIPANYAAFNEGGLIDTKQQEILEQLLQKYVQHLMKITSSQRSF